MKKLLKKKVNVFGKSVPVFAIVILGLALVSAALISFWGTITGSVIVTQGLFLDGKNYEAQITETWNPFTSLESKTFVSAHSLENDASVDAEVQLDYKCVDSNCEGIITGYYNPSMEKIITGADRLVATQNDDGGWDWTNPDLVLTSPSPENTFGVTAQGLLTAYELTGNQDYLDAAKLAGNHLVTLFGTNIIDNRINAFDIVFLYNLGEISGVDTYTNKADDLIGTLTEDNYWAHNYGSFCSATTGCTAQNMFDAIKNRRGAANIGIILWDLAPWVKAANLGEEYSWANDLKNIMDVAYDSLTNDSELYNIGLSGVVSATGNPSAVTALINKQASTGEWTSGNGAEQDTAYAVMALMSVGKMTEAVKGAIWLASTQGSEDGWSTPENTEVTSEVLQTMLLTEELTNPFKIAVPAGESVGFAIVNHFPKMLVPDTYIIETKVMPVTA